MGAKGLRLGMGTERGHWGARRELRARPTPGTHHWHRARQYGRGEAAWVPRAQTTAGVRAPGASTKELARDQTKDFLVVRTRLTRPSEQRSPCSMRTRANECLEAGVCAIVYSSAGRRSSEARAALSGRQTGGGWQPFVRAPPTRSRRQPPTLASDKFLTAIPRAAALARPPTPRLNGAEPAGPPPALARHPGAHTAQQYRPDGPPSAPRPRAPPHHQPPVPPRPHPCPDSHHQRRRGHARPDGGGRAAAAG